MSGRVGATPDDTLHLLAPAAHEVLWWAPRCARHRLGTALPPHALSYRGPTCCVRRQGTGGRLQYHTTTHGWNFAMTAPLDKAVVQAGLDDLIAAAQ